MATVRGKDASADLLYGTSKDDTIDGYGGNDEIHGGAGDDLIRGGEGVDKLFGDGGDYRIWGGNVNDELHGGTGNDLLRGDAGADTLFGDDGNDDISGGDGNDVINGGSGADTIYGDFGADVLTGTAQMVVGAIGKAKDSTVLWFGTQSNQTSLAPEIVVASQVYHWEGILKEMISLIQSGTLGGKSFKADLANGGEVIEFNPESSVAKDAETVANTTIEGIKSGSITITLP